MEIAEKSKAQRLHRLPFLFLLAPIVMNFADLTVFNDELTSLATPRRLPLMRIQIPFEHPADNLGIHSIRCRGGLVMKKARFLFAAGLLMSVGATGAHAFVEAQYQAVKQGKKSCQWCDLSGADLSKVKLNGVDLSGANLTGANLREADLRNVDFSGADLTGVVLDGANLSGANLTGADIDQVDLSGAVLKDAKLERANCDWATKLPEGSGLSCVGVAIERK